MYLLNLEIIKKKTTKRLILHVSCCLPLQEIDHLVCFCGGRKNISTSYQWNEHQNDHLPVDGCGIFWCDSEFIFYSVPYRRPPPRTLPSVLRLVFPLSAFMFFHSRLLYDNCCLHSAILLLFDRHGLHSCVYQDIHESMYSLGKKTTLMN